MSWLHSALGSGRGWSRSWPRQRPVCWSTSCRGERLPGSQGTGADANARGPPWTMDRVLQTLRGDRGAELALLGSLAGCWGSPRPSPHRSGQLVSHSKPCSGFVWLPQKLNKPLPLALPCSCLCPLRHWLNLGSLWFSAAQICVPIPVPPAQAGRKLPVRSDGSNFHRFQNHSDFVEKKHESLGIS